MTEVDLNGVSLADIVIAPTRVESEKPFPLAFFSAQAEYAKIGIDKLGLKPEWCWRNLTSFWLRVGREEKFNQFLGEVANGQKPDEVAHRLHREYVPYDVDDRPWFGCFTFDHNPNKQTIDIHFTNRDESGEGPLSDSRQEWRIAELRSMFAHIRRTHPDSKMVGGASWIFNLPRFTRLLPPAFSDPDHIKVWKTVHATNQALWGQLLKRNGNVDKEERENLWLRPNELNI